MRLLSGRIRGLGSFWRSSPSYRDHPIENGHANGNGHGGINGYRDHDEYGEKRYEYLSQLSERRTRWSRWRSCFCLRLPARVWVPSLVILLLLAAFVYQPSPLSEEQIHQQEEAAHTDDEIPPQLHGFYNGVYSLVHWSDWQPDGTQRDMFEKANISSADYGMSVHLKHPLAETVQPPDPPATGDTRPRPGLAVKPQFYSPYPPYTSAAYLRDYHRVETCWLDKAETLDLPEVFVYEGLPQNSPMPFFGSYDELGLRHDVCFERFGRFGPYGYGYSKKEGGLGLGLNSENVGVDQQWAIQPRRNWTGIDWADAQKRCYEKNKIRFNAIAPNASVKATEKARKVADTGVKKKVPRTAFLFRTWTGFEYTSHEILTLRSTINELSLKSGGEYHVYLFLHVRDDTVPIWASKEVAQKVIEENIPREFWGITVLWSVQQMRMMYPGPFTQNFDNPSSADIHEVYRGNHFPLQWFGAEHPEYDYVWNWEMDMRYNGQHYEFHDRVGQWAREQPRRGLWERNAKMWIPAYHGDYRNFTRFLDNQTRAEGKTPVWGPPKFESEHGLPTPPETKPPRRWQDDDFQWGVGEDADLITFNPIFDPSITNWVFRDDLSGYSLDLPIPPRRCAIITVSRLSRRLLDIMHKETFQERHSAFPEMWSPTVALHHGLKAVYVPHPVYFDRKWPLEYLDKTFNYPKKLWESPYGWGEHNFLGSSFYFNAGFSGSLWRRWLGEKEHQEGGGRDRGGHDAEKRGTGRMCLRSTLLHPVKKEDSPD